MGGLNDLIVYQKAFHLAMEVFKTTKWFPNEEKYALTDQIRRSSRSVCSNLAEAYRKRVYPKHFVAKLSDCLMENAETEVWLEFAYACGYIDQERFSELSNLNEEVGKLLFHMEKNPEKFGVHRQ